MANNFALLFHTKTAHFDYEPVWNRDQANQVFLSVTFPRVFNDGTAYQYRVRTNEADYGIHNPPHFGPNGEHTINFIPFRHATNGFPTTLLIRVYLVDPVTENQCLIAAWN